MTKEQIDNATLEAIYWWNRDEHYYHQYFSKIDIIYNDKPLLEFFIGKIFEVFLREYSIRRNISAGYTSVNKFINDLFKNDFVNAVKRGETDIIDEVSERIKSEGNSTKRQTRSLLSKVAFLINPNSFSLFDNLAKNAIWSLYKGEKRFKSKEISNYSGFMKQTNHLRSDIAAKGLFGSSYLILKEFKDTNASTFFKKHPNAFEMRIVDKFLWLLERNADGRQLLNAEYFKLNRMK